MKDYASPKRSLTASFRNEVYAVVAAIPAGKVLTYGDIARLLGAPRLSRMVGCALKEIPADCGAPCHRVVNVAGRLVPGWEEQRRLLEAEGVTFKKNDCVDMKRHLWKL